MLSAPLRVYYRSIIYLFLTKPMDLSEEDEMTRTPDEKLNGNKPQDKELSRREFIEKGYSSAMLALLVGGSAVLTSASGCNEDDDDGGDGDNSNGICNNTCEYAFDGDCDDSGTNADYSICDLGSDCDDCGTRYGNGSYSDYSDSTTYSEYSESTTYSNYSDSYTYSDYYDVYYQYYGDSFSNSW